MGWARGSKVLRALVESLRKRGLNANVRYLIYWDMLGTISEMDCDTLDEVCGIDVAYDEALADHYKALNGEDVT